MGVTEEISSTIDALADLEILKTTSDLLGEFAEVHLKLRENLDRVNLLDQLTLGFTIEEYLRIIGSVKSVFEARSKIYQQYITYKNDLTKKQESLDKLNSKYKSSVDKINLLTFEVDKLKQKVTQFEKSFNNISDTIKSEIDKFEMDKIEDFRNSVEIFIESSIESQKQSIELWETFYDRQNLAQI
ncbi:CIC11C00000001729 [Sungouiella intermedia]|uniref:CIC11C00000001729 n=1 Tax=Sungouiella intermedia TaxID=45354 RepID=A0A1L0G3Y8_9ASCO|nr:CIC11C00000001729 [[Candida] intermedia]